MSEFIRVRCLEIAAVLHKGEPAVIGCAERLIAWVTSATKTQTDRVPDDILGGLMPVEAKVLVALHSLQLPTGCITSPQISGETGLSLKVVNAALTTLWEHWIVVRSHSNPSGYVTSRHGEVLAERIAANPDAMALLVP